MANQNHLEILFPGWTEGKNYTGSDRVAWKTRRSLNRSEVPDLSGMLQRERGGRTPRPRQLPPLEDFTLGTFTFES
jgi:hypothetical protein